MDYVRDYLFVGEEHGMIRYDLHSLKTDEVESSPVAKNMLFFNGHFYFIGSYVFNQFFKRLLGMQN